MKKLKKILSMTLIYIFTVTLVLQGIPVKANAEDAKASLKPLNAVSGQVIVKLKDANNSDYVKILQNYGGNVLNKNEQDILVQVDNSKVQNIINDLQKDSNVLFTEVNASGKKQGNISTDNYGQDFLNCSNSREAWTLLPAATNQKQVTVAVVDSGVKANHPALNGKVLTNGYNFVSSNFVTDDDNGHGTEVAGVIAANDVNGSDVSGITGTANVKILPVKVLDSSGNGTSYNVAQGIIYAADHGAAVINVSITGQGYSQTIADAVTYAQGKNSLVICSSGDNKDYAENYWPCNSDGAVVVANTNGNPRATSNYGKVITFGEPGFGKTTTIDGAYGDVNGSSFSAAVVSGIAALGEIKYPAYTSVQIENIMKNSVSAGNTYNHYTGYGNIDAYRFLNTTNSLIEIQSPASGLNSEGDVNLKVAAIVPNTISKLEVYLNDATAPVTTITGNNSANYTYTIPIASLADGANKIAVKAYSTTGSTYTDIRYIREYKTNEHQVALKFTDLNGNPLSQGTRVFLQKDGNGQTVSDITDSNGTVVFYNTNLNTKYNVSYQYKNYDSSNINHPVFFKTQINSSSIPSVVDSSSLRSIAVSAKKADGTPLLNSKLHYGNGIYGETEYDDVFNESGNGSIYINDADNDKIKLVNESQGYLLEKTFPQGMYGVTSLNFAVDNTVTKVNINNTSYSSINSQILSVQDTDDFANYKLNKLTVNNNAIFLSKGMDYKYYYEANIVSNSKNYAYDYVTKSVSTNNSTVDLNYGKPHVDLLQRYISGKDSFIPTSVSVSDDYNNTLYLNNNTQITYDLNDLSNKLVKERIKNCDEITSLFNDQFPMDSVQTGSYTLNGKVNLGALGIINSAPVNISYTQPGSSSSSTTNANFINVSIKAPVSTMNNYSVVYDVYDNSSGKVVYQGFADYDINSNSALTTIDKSYFKSNYSITIDGYSELSSTQSFTFLYNRLMPAVPASSIVIDDSQNSAKQITVKTDDSTKQNIVQTGKLQIGLAGYPDSCTNGPLNYTMDSSGVTSIYLDKGNYNFQLQNYGSKYWLFNNINISDSNSTAVFSTSNLVKLSVTANNLTNYTNANISLSLPQDVDSIYGRYSIDLDKGSVYNISPLLNAKINNFTLQAFDIASGKNYNYNYDCYNNPITVNKDTNINLSDFTVKVNSAAINVNLPNSISEGYSITSGGYTLSNIYASDSYNFMNEYKKNDSIYLNLYNANNSLVRSTKYNPELGYTSATSTSLSDNSLSTGSYTAAIELPVGATNISGNSFTVNLDSSSIQKLKVMNPFNTSQPADNAKVFVKGDFKTYQPDVNGYAYVNKSNISSASDITISVESLDSQSTAIYSPDNITQDSSGCINVNKSISALNKLQVVTTDASNKFNFSNKLVNVVSNNRSFSTNLNYNGQKNIYLPQGSYVVTSDNLSDHNNDTGYLFMQNVNLTGNQVVNFDTSNMACVKVNSNNQYHNLNLNYTNGSVSNTAFINSVMSAIYVSPATTINYQYTANGIQGTGTFATAANVTNTINIGKSYGLSATIDSAALNPFDTISASIAISDEYKNNLSISNLSALTAVVTQNGQVVDTLNCNGNSNGKYQFNLNGDLAGSANVHFVADLGALGKITTADIPINISSDGYYVINITDPLGKPAANGDVRVATLDSNNYLYDSANVKINKNGTVFINKSSLRGSENKIVISGFTSDTKDPFVYYRDFSTGTISYGAVNTKVTNIKTNITGLENPSNGCLFVTSGYNNLFANYNSISISNDKYSNFNLYLDKGIYNINYEISDYYGNSSSYHLIKKNLDSSTDNSVVFDNSVISKVTAVYDGNLSTDSRPSFQLRINNLNSQGTGVDNQYYSKTDYDEADAYVNDNNSGIGMNFTRKNLTLRDDVTEIHFGKDLTADSSVYNHVLDNCLTAGDTMSLNYSLKDSEGFSTSAWGDFTVKFSQNGALIQSVSCSNQITVPNLPEGFYDVDVYYLSSQSGIKLESKKVYVGASAASFVTINRNYGYDFSVYDGTNKLFEGKTDNGDITVPKSILDTVKVYNVYEVSGNGINSYAEIINGSLSYDTVNSVWSFNSPSDMVNFNITNASGMHITVKDSSGRTTGGTVYDNGNFNMHVSSGTYSLNFKGTGADGNFYNFNRSITVSASNTSYAVDYSNLCKVVVTNSYPTTPTYGSHTFIKTDGSSSFSFEDGDTPLGIAYIDKGSYNVAVNKIIRGFKNAVTGTYTLDCSGDSAALNLGAKLNVNSTLDKASYNVGDVPVISSVSVSDGGTVLSGFSASDFSISSIDVMHGTRVIKSFSGFIPNYLKGECELRANFSNGMSGNVQPVTINNTALTVSGDINLDGIVDIYDLVLMSKDIGKTKVNSADWDGRCNIDNSDNSNVIDIKDLAKAAQNYNSRD